ncbi:MAG: haloacid dehalogenase type II [Myxococcales bacterium]|nr:haloacid dehalogenase type II [Myxococcales bacterium]
MLSLDAMIFDAYGTLFDVHAATRRLADRLGPRASRLSDLWRSRQVQYTWLRACMEQYAPFWEVTSEALDYAMEAVDLRDDTLKADLLATYRQVEPYADVLPALDALTTAGVRRGVFSNADPAMLTAAVEVSGLASRLDAVISVDGAGTFKPRPAVYAHAVQQLTTTPERTGFVTANGWDAAGASAAGLRAVWVNRAGAPVERLPARPMAVVPSLTEAVTTLLSSPGSAP